MKINRINKLMLAFCTTSILMTAVLFGSISLAQRNDTGLILSVNSDKQIYIQGETVSLTFEITNETSNAIALSAGTQVRSGDVGLQIAAGDNNFKTYNGPGWGIEDASYPSISLNAGETYKTQVSVLFNSVPSTSHLNSDAAKDVLKGIVPSNYAFQNSGVYKLKAVWHTLIEGKPRVFESKPIKITITQPVGEDLEVWNKIKDGGDIAFFLQEGSFRIPNYKTKEREEFRQKIEQLIIDHPNSFYAELFKRSLQKFQLMEDKRRAFQENLKKQQ